MHKLMSVPAGDRILLVDDQPSLRRSLSLMLQTAGFETGEAANAEEALLALTHSPYNLVVTDLRMDGMSGMDLLEHIKRQQPGLPVIVITAYGSIESAVEAMRRGAFDYLTKPFRDIDLIDKIRASLTLAHTTPRGQSLGPEKLATPAVPDDLVVSHPQMVATMIKADRVAQTEISVFITGETGTGKTRLARTIHRKSLRSAGPFVSINCASLPEQLLESELFGHIRGSFTGATETRPGLFEEADTGTIFLDEVDTLSLSMQAKLLSALQDKQIRRVGSNKSKPVDIRVISASNLDIPSLIDRGLFRADLYFRLNGVRLHLLPLRERGEDFYRLFIRFLDLYSAKYGHSRLEVAPRAMEYIKAYPYPGNIRELESFVEQMVVFADGKSTIDVNALPDEVLHGPVAPVRYEPAILEPNRLADSERLLIESALARFRHIGEAARELGIGRTTLWRKMRLYNIPLKRIPRRK